MTLTTLDECMTELLAIAERVDGASLHRILSVVLALESLDVRPLPVIHHTINFTGRKFRD